MSTTKKFHIFLDFEKTKGGGGSFLSFLRSELIKQNMYTHQWYLADSILINSHHISKTKAMLVKYYPFKKKRIVHRIDGPMRVYNHKNDLRDDMVVWLNRHIADATIFQSKWSYGEHLKLYGEVSGKVEVIPNIANSEYFKPKQRSYSSGKLNLISTVWSQNINKGYETYQWLDRNLDFSKFSFELIGAPQHQFKNIHCLPYMKPQELNQKLQEAHVFIFPSRYEACSNALLEALATGLPCITYNGSSNVEVITNPALWFRDDNEIIRILDEIYKNYDSYLPKVLPSVEDIVQRYIHLLRG